MLVYKYTATLKQVENGKFSQVEINGSVTANSYNRAYDLAYDEVAEFVDGDKCYIFITKLTK